MYRNCMLQSTMDIGQTRSSQRASVRFTNLK